MRDLEIKGTGNSRNLKSAIPEGTTWEQAIEMLRGGTFPIDLLGLNSDGVVDMSASAYSKANVLPDAICELIDIDSVSSEIKDAILALFYMIDSKKNRYSEDDFFMYVTGKHPALSACQYNDYSMIENV